MFPHSPRRERLEVALIIGDSGGGNAPALRKIVKGTSFSRIAGDASVTGAGAESDAFLSSRRCLKKAPRVPSG